MKTTDMFKAALTTAVIAASMAIGNAQATPLYTLDTLIGSADMANSSDSDELAKLIFFAGLSLTEAAKITQDSATFNIAQNPGTTNEWFVNVDPSTPGYFMLKFAAKPGAADHFFFKNVGELGQLVFSNSQVNNLTGDCGSNSCNSGKLSHYLYTASDSTGDPEGNPVPEPTSLALFGLGLMGLVIGRRKFGK